MPEIQCGSCLQYFKREGNVCKHSRLKNVLICDKCHTKMFERMMDEKLSASATIRASISAAMPAVRETMEVPFYNGSEHTRISVYKDDFEKQLRQDMGLGPTIKLGVD